MEFRWFLFFSVGFSYCEKTSFFQSFKSDDFLDSSVFVAFVGVSIVFKEVWYLVFFFAVFYEVLDRFSFSTVAQWAACYVPFVLHVSQIGVTTAQAEDLADCSIAFCVVGHVDRSLGSSAGIFKLAV